MSNLRKIRHHLSKTKARIPLTWRRHQGLRPEDVFIASYPRSGNTWLRFLLFELLSGQQATFETISRSDSPVPEIHNYSKTPPLLPGNGRLIKTHELYRREYRKAIYLVRDARDVVMSEYNYVRWLDVYDKDFDDFVGRFLTGRANGYGTWNEHVHSWLEAEIARDGRLLVIRYEDMRRDSEATLAHICNFLGLKRDIQTIREAIRHNDIAIMRQKEESARQTALRYSRKDVNFVHQGKIEGWRQVLTESQVRLIEQHARESLIRMGYPIFLSTTQLSPGQ